MDLTFSYKNGSGSSTNCQKTGTKGFTVRLLYPLTLQHSSLHKPNSNQDRQVETCSPIYQKGLI
jgi:hypothetical protein